MVSAQAGSTNMLSPTEVLSAAGVSIKFSESGITGVSSLQAAKTVSARGRRQVNTNDLPPPYNIS